VPFDEARDRQIPAEIDDTRVRATVDLDLFVRSDRNDPATAGGERLGFSKRVVDGDQLAVNQDQLRRFGTGRASGERHDQERNQEN